MLRKLGDEPRWAGLRFRRELPLWLTEISAVPAYNPGMAPEFPADKRTLSQFQRFTGRAEGLSISFEAHLLGSKIEYDEGRDMLIIRQLPTQLKDQLKRRQD